MKVKIEELIKKYQKQKIAVINPDNLTWDDLGFDEPMDEFIDVNDYLENSDESEFDEGEQTEIAMLSEIIHDLETIIK